MMIIDDSCQRQEDPQNHISSLIVLQFDPNTYEMTQLENQQLFQSDQPIFMNSHIYQGYIFYIQIDEQQDQDSFTFNLMKKHLSMTKSTKVQRFKIKVKPKNVTSIILSKVFQGGNLQANQSKLDWSNLDNEFLQDLYLGVSTQNETQDYYETEIFKLKEDSKSPFKKQDTPIELSSMIHMPNFLMLNTSSFEVFTKGRSHSNQSDGYGWQIQENFLALNGWNHLTRDKRTVYKLIEILSTENFDHELKLDQDHVQLLHEVSPMKINFQDYMVTHGCITNILVRYFREMSPSLSHYDVLYHQIPELNTFEAIYSPISIEPQIVQEQSWPQELKNVCNILYDKYMDSLYNLRESRKFSLTEQSEQNFVTQAIFDNIQSKFFLMVNFFSGGYDELIFIEIKQPQNHFEIIRPDQTEFKSDLDKHLSMLFCDDQLAAYRGNSKFTVSKKLSNVTRSHTHVNLHQGPILNTIDDRPNKFNVLNSKVMNIFKKQQDLLSKDIQREILKMSNLGGDESSLGSVGFCEEASFFYRFKDKKCFNLTIVAQSKDQKTTHQLDFKEYDRMEELPLKQEVMLLAQKVRFVEDDRYQVPFIAISQPKKSQSNSMSSVWFVILDLLKFKVERTVNLNLTNTEQKELMRSMSLGHQIFDQIVLCQSQSCQQVDKSYYSSNLVKYLKKCFMDKYQIAIFLKETRRIKIFEMSLFWNQQQMRSDLKVSLKAKKEVSVVCFQSGQKELFAKSDRHFDCVQLIPVFDNSNRITCTQLLIKQEDEIGRIVLNENFKNFNFHTQNDIFKFGYKIFRAQQSQALDFLLIDTNFSSKILMNQDKGLFRDFIFSQLLCTQIKTIANMIPFDFVSWVTRDTSKSPRYFRPLELLQGHSIIEYIFKDPHQLQLFLENKDQIYSDYKFMTLLERITHDDPDRQSTLRQIGIMSQKKELSYNFYQGNCLERCFLGEDTVELMSSADLLIQHMLNFKMSETQSIRNMLVSILPYVTIENENRLNFSKQYINFFIDTPDKTISNVFQDQKDEYDEIHQRFEIAIQDEDHTLQRYLDDDLSVEHLTLTSKQFGEIDLSSRVKSHIQSRPKPGQSIYEVQHSYIDLRQINLSFIRQTLNGNVKHHKNCTEYLLSDCVFTLVKNYFEKIGDCSVIQKLIKDVYQRRTRNYYIFLFVVYILGFVVPFVNLIFKAIKKKEVVQDDDDNFLVAAMKSIISMFQNENFELYICLMTQGLLLYIELIQFVKYKEDYLQSVWNFVDILNFILYLIFFALRMNLLPSVESEGHKFLPISYMSEESQDGEIAATESLDGDKIFTLAVMQSVSIILIGSIILKIFSFLKVIPSIGAFIETFYKILFASQQFLIFFSYWILTFALCFMVVGIKLEDLTQPDGNFYDSHTTNQIIIAYILLSVKNSIAGPEDPTDNFWTNISKETVELYPNLVGFMRLAVILLWIAGLYLLLVILLNMLISIVSEAYSEFSEHKPLYTFRQQAEMNRECNLILSSFPANLVFNKLGMDDDLDCIVLSSAVDQEPSKENEMLELSQGVRNMILSQNQLIQIQSQQIQLQSKQFSLLQDQLKDIDQRITSAKPSSIEPNAAQHAVDDERQTLMGEMEEFQFRLVSNQRRGTVRKTNIHKLSADQTSEASIMTIEDQMRAKQQKKIKDMAKIMKVQLNREKRIQEQKLGKDHEGPNFDEDDDEDHLQKMFNKFS